MTARPYATRDEAYAELASSPVLSELHGHPRAIVSFAPLLEEHKLEELMERAKECYTEATKTRSPPVNDRRDEGGNIGANGGGIMGMMRGEGTAGALHTEPSDGALSEREVDEARRYLTDPACQRIWLEVRRALFHHLLTCIIVLSGFVI